MKDRLLERSDCRGEYRYGSSTSLELERRPVRIAALNLEGREKDGKKQQGASETISGETFRCCCVVAIDFVQHGGLIRQTQPGTMASAKSGRQKSG